jgi:hypothetical protein
VTPAPTLGDLVQRVRDRSPGPDPLARISVAVAVSGEITSLADLLLGHFVEGARQAGCSWAQIGAALGVSKQGAQQRFVGGPAGERSGASQAPSGATGRVRATLVRAQGEARARGHNYVGTEHVLLALLVDPQCLAVRVLDVLAVSTDELRQAVAAAAGPPSPGAPPPGAQLPLTPRTQRVLDRARGESVQLGHNYIGTEHLLLALAAEENGIGGRVLREHGVDAGRARAEVVRALSGWSQAAPR